MFFRYYYKIIDSWTKPLKNFPRWLSPNSYSDLTDSIEYPTITSFSTGVTLTSPTSSLYPLSWVLPTYSSPTTGSSLQKFIDDIVSYESSVLDIPLSSWNLASHNLYDTTDPQYIWVVDYYADSNQVNSVDIKISNNTVVGVKLAEDILDFFWSGEWRYTVQNNTVYISGLDLIEQDTENRVGDWQFISNANLWDISGPGFLKHPQTGNWIFLHPLTIRDDGLLNFVYNGSLKFRSRLNLAASGLPTVQVLVNDQLLTARRIDLWNTVDEKGLLYNISRRAGESNFNYGSTINLLGWFSGQNKERFKNTLSIFFRTGESQTIVAGATGISFPALSTGYSIRNVDQYYFISETLTPNIDNTTSFRSRISTPDTYSFSRLNNLVTIIDNVSGTVFSPNSYVNNKIDRLDTQWRVSLWSESTSGLIFTDNFPNSDQEFEIYFPKKVDILEPDISALRRLFIAYSPIYRWKSYTNNTEEDFHGVSSFD